MPALLDVPSKFALIDNGSIIQDTIIDRTLPSRHAGMENDIIRSGGMQ
jgi:hypothetical protein